MKLQKEQEKKVLEDLKAHKGFSRFQRKEMMRRLEQGR